MIEASWPRDASDDPEIGSLAHAFNSARRAATTPLRAAIVSRAIEACARLVAGEDETALGEAVAASSDVEALYRLLSEPSALAMLTKEDPLLEARLNGLRARAGILDAEGGAVDVTATAAILGVTRQAIDRRRKAGHLLGLTLGRRGYVYPLWQFVEGGVLPGMDKALDALSEYGPWFQAAWLLRPNARLADRTPLSVLRGGDVAAVVAAARAYGEGGA